MDEIYIKNIEKAFINLSKEDFEANLDRAVK